MCKAPACRYKIAHGPDSCNPAGLQLNANKEGTHVAFSDMVYLLQSGRVNLRVHRAGCNS